VNKLLPINERQDEPGEVAAQGGPEEVADHGAE